MAFDVKRWFENTGIASLPEAMLWQMQKLGSVYGIDFRNYIIWVSAKNSFDRDLFEMIFGVESPERVIKEDTVAVRVAVEDEQSREPELITQEITYHGCDYTNNGIECGELATFEIITHDGIILHDCPKHGEYILKNKERWGVKSFKHQRNGVILSENKI